jgi:hypothetical protein
VLVDGAVDVIDGSDTSEPVVRLASSPAHAAKTPSKASVDAESRNLRAELTLPRGFA